MTAKVEIPKRLPILLVTDGVVFPTATVRIPVKTNQNINMVEHCLSNMVSLRSAIIAIAYKQPEDHECSQKTLPGNLHLIGTAAIVTQMAGSNWPRPSYTLQVTGLCRIKLEQIVRKEPFMMATVSQLDKIPGKTLRTEDMENSPFMSDVWKLLDTLSARSTAIERLRVKKRILKTAPLDVVTDMCVSFLETATYGDKLGILDNVILKERVECAHKLVKRQLESFEESKSPEESYTVELFPESARVDELSKIVSRLIDGSNARKPNTTIAQPSGNKDELLRKLKETKMPPEVEKMVLGEHEKLKKMSNFSPEYTSLRNYLELMADLPWSVQTTDSLDVQKAKVDLDTDHYGLADVKKRVLEYLAVRQMRNDLKGPILCFVGPPGVGKTSIAKSVAKTLGRNFHRISLGGVCDQSDVRGHRRTYIGSMPGRIIQGLKTAKSRNPVFLLDEIDKTSPGVHGDPASALLEVLDPEQNCNFVDHYVNAPFDLSQVLFLATANTSDTIPSPLLDRMEIIPIAGYTHEEKVKIAVDHLIPKQLKENGITPQQMHVPNNTIVSIVHGYTREAGVRSLERRVGALCRAVALRIAQFHSENKSLTADSVEKPSMASHRLPDLPIVIDEQALEDILGPKTYLGTGRETLMCPGVAAGLAWTPVGGEIMYVEATKMHGQGKLTLTGQLGDVMKESARLALNWLRSHSTHLGLPTDLADGTDVHVHFPAGAISKDGPSAGVTVLVALVSLFTNRCVRHDTAMTGEITLRGAVLPVGGIKDKVLAAHRAGFSRIIMPRRNEKDMVNVSDEVKNQVEMIFVDSMEEALSEAFENSPDNLTNSKL